MIVKLYARFGGVRVAAVEAELRKGRSTPGRGRDCENVLNKRDSAIF